MLAVPRYNIHPVGNIPLQMKHALTCVGFQIAGDGDEKITGISISGIAVSGDVVVDGSNIVWTNLGEPASTDFSASLNYDAGKNYYSVTESMSTNLIASDGYLMMIPQTLGNDAKVKITFEDNSTKEINLNLHTWDAGKRVSYYITLTADGTITVMPDNVLLPYTAQNPASQFVTVNCQKANGENAPNTEWTLSVPAADTWLKLSLNENGSNAAASVSGKGTQKVYLVATENTQSIQRTSAIYLGDNSADVVSNVTQLRYPGTFPDNDGAGIPASARTYVGAFWKANQTGERIIRINATNIGAWTASVIWLDPRWGDKDGVILDVEKLAPQSLLQRGISYTANIEPDWVSSAEDHPVTGNASVVSGVTTADDRYIAFRIGLKSQYTSTAQYPARYAVLLLSFDNNTKFQKIYLRQGENPDYLMMNGDQLGPESFISQRTQSKKFAVYNLTAETLDAQVKPRGAIFTDYPTKAGAMWQWAIFTDNTYTRMAFHPAKVPSDDIWFPNNTELFWDKLKDFNEVSPEGYRRPTDGPTGVQSHPEYAVNIEQWEMRQSLFWRVRKGVEKNNEVTNSMWGYYADGYFDRRNIEDANTAESPSGFDTKNVVSDGSKDVAYIGRLFFNPVESSDRYNASIFFPATGWVRYHVNQTKVDFVQRGFSGGYWTSSAYHYTTTEYDGLHLRITVGEAHYNHSAMWYLHKANGLSIRPVVE
jgi:hypothetical protein